MWLSFFQRQKGVFMETTILGIDHGNGNIKTASSVFLCGFKKQETKPSQIFSQDILEYKGCFYSLTPNRFPYEIDKTKNENCLILTLFAIAKEIKARAMKNKSDFDWKKILADLWEKMLCCPSDCRLLTLRSRGIALRITS